MKKPLAIFLTFLAVLLCTASARAFDLDMPEPAAFPDDVYLLELVRLPDLSAVCDEAQLLELLGSTSRPDDHCISLNGHYLYYEPLPALNMEHCPYPIVDLMSPDTLYTDVENGAWGAGWRPCQTSSELIAAQREKAAALLNGIGFACGGPSSLYRSVLADGRATTEIGFPLMVEGLPMHSNFFLAPGAYETTSGDWGYMLGDSAHVIILDNMEVYSLYIPEYVVVEGKERVTLSATDTEQALQLLEAQRPDLQQRQVVVTSMRPCYLKHPVDGTNERYTARPSWEITYYDKRNGEVIDDFWTSYVDAVSGEVY